MYLLLSIGIVVLAATCVFLVWRCYYQCRYIKISKRVNDEVLRNVAAYILLVDPDFDVLQTNYYTLTGTPLPSRPPKVGNLLRCKNGEDAGICGTHDLCADCPVRAAIGEAFRSKKGFSGLEAPMVLYTSDDHSEAIDCDVSVSGNFLTIAGESRVVLTVSDITAQKRTQRELEKARIHAEESDRMKSFFLTNTTHELRTPLNAIVGFSELLMTDSAPEDKQEYMRIIRLNSEVLLHLINDLLDLSKIETGTLDYEYSDVELNAVMEELEGGFRIRQPENSPVRITFHRQYPASYLHTDRKRLIQVVANFLSNAVKFTANGSIDFGFEIRGSELYIYVTDTGTGISEEHQRELFQRFTKAGSFKQGIGIGLAISKSIVETLGGDIGVESQIGKGSTFWFTLPYGTQQ
ncbi:HAMP domain-containing sensor histidine kinase [uncultured Alistipes sp.]|uniref:sensor histidine kinase n=1 Tax=uncultured Alistipes sp. TaxID=538949 RepID=UPI002585D7B0|nr:HAMP domain-containing sensor histidine kinase [uncultured Alistipes sp.]